MVDFIAINLKSWLRAAVGGHIFCLGKLMMSPRSFAAAAVLVSCACACKEVVSSKAMSSDIQPESMILTYI